MKGILVLEGADGTGKTTLARELVARYSAFYIHNGLWPDIWKRHVAALRLALRKSQEQLVIIDRLWLSEQIYGDTFRAGPAYDLGARCLDRVLMRYGAVTVLCVRHNFSAHMRHFEELKQTRREKFSRMEAVAFRYLDLAAGNLATPGNLYYQQLTRFQDYALREDVMIYDFEAGGRNLPQTGKAIVDRIRWLREGAAKNIGLHEDVLCCDDFSNLAGNPRRPNYLLVGEALSPRACRQAAPFFWSDASSSASYLNAQLRDLQFREDRALWVNALATDDWLPRLRDQLDSKTRVIALGGIAARRVGELGFPNAVCVPHPQWARRFQASRPEKYKDILQGALKL